jgi:hypothetical protein
MRRKKLRKRMRIRYGAKEITALLSLFTRAYCLPSVVLSPSPVGGFICQVSVLLGHSQNMLLPLSPWHKNLTMMSRFWRHFRPTHANCHSSADRARPAQSANAWRLARVGQNGRQKTFARAAMRGRWAPPLSLVQNIKIYFINNTHYFRTRF